MKRTKYLFADRKTAEDECQRQSRQANSCRFMLTAIVSGEAQQIRGSYYDAYVVPREWDYGLVMIVYHGAECQQKPCVTVYTGDEIKDWRDHLIRARAFGMGNDRHEAQDRQLAQLLQDALIVLDGGHSHG